MRTEAIDKLFLELSQFTKAKTEREYALESHCRQLMSAGVEALNCMGAGSDVQTERVKFYKKLNAARAYFGEDKIDPDLSKNDFNY